VAGHRPAAGTRSCIEGLLPGAVAPGVGTGRLPGFVFVKANAKGRLYL
jgi:hypothetical protein